jgi:hypothetical protein
MIWIPPRCPPPVRGPAQHGGIIGLQYAGYYQSREKEERVHASDYMIQILLTPCNILYSIPM